MFVAFINVWSSDNLHQNWLDIKQTNKGKPPESESGGCVCVGGGGRWGRSVLGM